MPTFQDVILAIPGLTHYYPLANDANDIVGDAHGEVSGNVDFDGTWARFDGNSEIDLGDSDDFSAATTGEISIVVFQTVDDWRERSDNNEYIHWMGKGKSGSHEWVFRYYCDGCSGEAPQRKRRTSFYNFNPDGGLGTGSYFQDEGDGNGTERVITGLAWGNAGNGGKTQMWKNGELRDTDMLSDYDVYPKNTGSHVFLGSRGDGTGNLVGRLRRVAFFDRKLTEAEIKSIYNARSYEEGSGSSGGGGGGTPPAPDITADVIINGQTHVINGVNVDRGSGELIAYTKAFGSATTTNEWGAEVRVEGGFITEVLDQQASTAGDHNLALEQRGFVLSGHGEARTWLLANATVGVRAGFTDFVIPPPPTGGGGGGGGETDLTAVQEAYEDAQATLNVLNSKFLALGDAIDTAAGE